MSTSTYAPPFLQGLGGQPQGPPWFQGAYGQPGQFGSAGLEQFQQYGQGQQPFGPFGQQQQPFGGQSMGAQGPGIDQIVPSVQLIIQLLGNAQQALLTAQHVAAQLPAYLAATQQPQQQQRQFPQLQRPYSMAW